MAEQMLQLDPAKVLVEENIRFGLRGVEELAANILETNGVLVPVGVKALAPAVNGFTHRLVYGARRHAAVSLLNSRDSAGLVLPARLVETADETAQLKVQIAENRQRENMSPMDDAVAIKKLMDAKVERAEIRRIFARPKGLKGDKTEPASNAWVNIMLNLLELPKSIQEDIHSGLIGVGAAYELGKVPPDKRKAIVDRARAERAAELASEERDEERYIDMESKNQKAAETVQQALSAVEQAKANVEAAKAAKAEKDAALKAAGQYDMTADESVKAAAKERFDAAKADVKGADKALKDAQNELAKALSQQKKGESRAEEIRKKLDALRKAKSPSKKKAIGREDIKEAARKEGIPTEAYKPLQPSEMRDALKEILKTESAPAKVRAICAGVLALFSGKPLPNGIGSTPKQLIIYIGIQTGEIEEPQGWTAAPASVSSPVKPSVTAPAPAKGGKPERLRPGAKK